MSRPTRRAVLAAGASSAAALAAGAVTGRAQTSSPASAASRLPNLRRYLHYDVFTSAPHTGNQLAVFMEPQGLTPDTMAALTREMNYSECTFVFPAETAGTTVRLRIFGRAGEMPFAGHPVIGSTFALADDGRIPAGTTDIVFGLGIGPTPVALEWDGPRLRFAWMTQQRPVFGPTLATSAQLAAAIGVTPDQIVPRLPVQEVSCGSAFFYVPLTTRAAVDAVQMNGRELDTLFKAAGVTRRGLFVFTTEGGPDGATVYSRMVGATGAEDPATGSASGPLGCYLVRHGLVPAAAAGTIVSAQGVKMGRPSRLHIRLALSGDDITRVQVGGTSVLVGDGRLRAS
ncbi:MAG: PhzF family phenazine biosynthesis protein [Acidobacteria bacterium]|nr:PhzF family phenazine biosynthesis protein [Acidobacteriota bacterium]